MKRLHMTRGIMVLAAVVVGGLLVGGAIASAAIAGASDGAPAPHNQVGTEWPKDARGLTYGSAADARSPQDEPDLIQTMATNGVTGYVLKTDLDGPTPKTPEEALRQQAAQAGTERVIPVYQSDGVTQIGVFVIGGKPAIPISAE
jgi:hypothetical protein